MRNDTNGTNISDNDVVTEQVEFLKQHEHTQSQMTKKIAKVSERIFGLNVIDTVLNIS